MASIRDKPHDPRTTNHYVGPASLLPVWTCLAPLRRPLSRAGSTRRNHPRPAMAQPLATRAQPRAATARDLATRAGLSWPTVLDGYGWRRRSRRDLGSPGLPSQGSAWSPSLPALPPPAADLDDPPATARAKSPDPEPPAPTRQGNRVNIRITGAVRAECWSPCPRVRPSGQHPRQAPRSESHHPLCNTDPAPTAQPSRPSSRNHYAPAKAAQGDPTRGASGGTDGNHASPLAVAAQRNQDPGREWRHRG